jgi:uncharacterized protein YegJ (DUF2314 family)
VDDDRGARFGVYLDTEPDAEELIALFLRELERLADEPFRARLREHAARGGLDAVLRSPEEYPPPRLDGPEGERLRRARAIALFWGEETQAAPELGHLGALGAAWTAAREHRGLLFDPGRNKLLPVATDAGPWPRDGRFVVRDHVDAQWSVDHETGRAWATTKGLTKFGLPELECHVRPVHVGRAAARFLHLAAGAFVEALWNRLRERPGEKGPLMVGPALALEGHEPVELSLRYRHRDGLEPFVEILPPRAADGWWESMTTRLFGEQERVEYPPPDDPELERAEAEARARLPEARRRFQAGLGPGEKLLVKTAFPIGDGAHEHLWIEIDEWLGSTLTGRVSNRPLDVELRSGARVTFDEQEVEDWLIAHADGTTEGWFSRHALGGE